MTGGTDQEIERAIVGNGLASQSELDQAKRQIQRSGQPVTLTRVLEALVRNGIISDGQAQRVRTSVEPSSSSTIKAICSHCGRTTAVRGGEALHPCPACGGMLAYQGTTIRAPDAPQSADPFEGATIEGGCGAYRIAESLGAGGFSSVYRAQLIDERAGASYDRAVKVLHPHLATAPGSTEAFLAEARALQQITHPAVIRVYESGVHGGRPYIVMDLARGRSLNEFLQEQGGPLSVPTALTVGAKIASALREVHAAGLIHRDVKPSNIIVRHEDNPATLQALLLDFGVARPADGVSSDHLTYAGTKHYESPEQELGHPTQASDVWALGVVLYRMLNARPPGTPPSATQHPGASQLQNRRRTPHPFNRLDTSPAVQAEVEAVVKDCLKLSPEKRPSAETLAVTLEHLRAKALTVPPAARAAKAIPRWRRPLVWASASAVVMLLLGVLWAIAGRERGSPDHDDGVLVEQTDTLAAKLSEIADCHRRGLFADAFHLVDGLRLLDNTKADTAEDQTAQAVRASVLALVAGCKFAEASAIAEQLRPVRSELAETLAVKAHNAKRDFVRIAEQLLARTAAWPECTVQLRDLYAAEVDGGGFTKAEQILTAFARTGATYQKWLDANLEPARLQRRKQEFTAARDHACAALTQAVETAPNEAKWQTALRFCGGLSAFRRHPEPRAMTEACTRGLALARAFRDLDAQIEDALSAEGLTLATLDRHLDKVRRALLTHVGQRLGEVRQMLDGLRAHLQYLPSRPRHRLEATEKAIRTRDPGELLDCLTKAQQARAQADTRAWRKIWDTYCALEPRRPTNYRLLASKYTDLVPPPSPIAAEERTIRAHCGAGRFGEALAAIDQLRKQDQPAAETLDLEVASALTREVGKLSDGRQYTEARALAESVRRLRPRLADTLTTKVSEAGFGDAYHTAKETLDAERKRPAFDKQRWAQITNVCEQLSRRYSDKPRVSALADDCHFYMTEAQARGAPAPAQRQIWMAFLQKYPQSPHAAKAKRSRAQAQQEGQKQLDRLLATVADVKAALDAKSGQEHAKVREALTEAQRTLTRIEQQAQALNRSFEQTLELDLRPLAEVRDRIAFEEHRARATDADEPDRCKIWTAFFEQNANSAYASQALRTMKETVAAATKASCDEFDGATKEAPTPTTYERIEKDIDRAHVVLKSYEEAFANRPDFDLSPLRQELDRRRDRLNARLVVRSRPEGAEVLVNGERLPGRTPLSYDRVVARCAYRVKVAKERCLPREEEVTITNEDETTLELALEERVPELPAGLSPAVWRVPKEEMDQYGNPVVTRNGLRCDPKTQQPYEIWLEYMHERRAGSVFSRKPVRVKARMEFVLVPAAEYTVTRIEDEYQANAIGIEGSGSIPPVQPKRTPKLVPQRLRRSVYLGKYEVTRDQFVLHYAYNAKDIPPSPDAGPAFSIMYSQALSFCKKLTTVAKVRVWLPSDTVWECACRGGTRSRYPWGDALDPKYGNFGAKMGDGKVSPVGAYAPSAFGFYDMIGNVAEWCDEWHSDTDWPRHSICRGGDFTSADVRLTAHFRYLARKDKGRRGDYLGLRVCVMVPEQE